MLVGIYDQGERFGRTFLKSTNMAEAAAALAKQAEEEEGAARLEKERLENEEKIEEKVKDLAGRIVLGLEERKDLLKYVGAFAKKETITRMMVDNLRKEVENYNKLDDLDSKFAENYTDWLVCCGKSSDQLEQENHPWKPSDMEPMFDVSGDLKDKVLSLFKKVKEQFPNVQKVINYLDFIDNVPVAGFDGAGSGGRSETVGVGKGDDYVKRKIPMVQKEIEEKFEAVRKQGDEEELSLYSLQQIAKRLESLGEKLEKDFDQLLREFYSIADVDQKDFEEKEEWQQTQLALMESLKLSVAARIDRKKEVGGGASGKRSDFSTFFKKQDPPKFLGDCLEYLEWKTKWTSQVSSHSPPVEFEIDLLKKHLPEQGKMKLFGVENLENAWKLLDRLYGDKKLICQKLKNKLKTLKPKATEAHEVIIELSDMVDYLVKRLTELGAKDLLDIDNDYLNAVYQHLPDYYQLAWDSFDADDFASEWTAFMKFMQDTCAAALKKRTRVESLRDMHKDPKDTKKGKGGKDNVDILVVNTNDESSNKGGGGGKKQEKIEEMRKRFGKCKLCKGDHTFKGRFDKYFPSDRFMNCFKFRGMDTKQRGETLEKFKSCVRCTSWNHSKSNCSGTVVSCQEKVDGVVCGKDHSRLVCGSGVAYCTSLTIRTSREGIDEVSPDDIENMVTIPYIQDVPVEGNGTKTLGRLYWDEGSNRYLINNEFAAENKLRSKPATVVMNVAGGGKHRMKVKLFELHLVDRKGYKHKVWGYGVDNILDPDEPIDPGPVRSLFPHVPEAAFAKLEKRRIDILAGINYNGLMPSGGQGKNCVGNLKALETKFGDSGWILGGSHKKLQVFAPRFSSLAAEIRVARVQVIPEVTVSCIDTDVEEEFHRMTAAKVSIEPELNPEYWEKDQLGVEPPRKCTKCRQCAAKGECSEKHIIHTLQEENELRLIADNVKVENGEVHVQYPFLKDPGILPYNRSTVVKIQEKLWTGLKKDGLLDVYNAEIKKYVERGTFIKLSKKEMNDYAGPTQYITHHAVLKDSASTPVRSVTNSSFKNGSHSLNSLLPKGPNSLNDMLGVTVKFRSYRKVFAYDLSKAYNTMRTGMVERHLRRFVWRDNEDEPFQDYAIDRVHFGDRPAACQLEVSKKKIAELGVSIDEDAAQKLIEDTYVDDGFTGGEDEDVKRMVGNKDADGNFDGTISRILNLGGYSVKDFVVEGDMEQSDHNLLNNTVFGYGWNPKTGMMKMPISLNMSKKRRNQRTEPNLQVKDLETLESIKMTKRNLLGITNSFGDFLGMAEPFTIRFRLLMKSLFEPEKPLLWDDAIDDVAKAAWIKLIAEAVQAGEHIFPRRSRPDKIVGNPRLVGFGDGAFPAYGGCVYQVWEYSCEDYASCDNDECGGAEGGGHFAAFLVLAKGRVTPLRGYTVPRGEMSGGVLVSRMMLRVTRSLQSLPTKPFSSIILLDSTCTISALEVSSAQLKPFFHNRRSEMLDNMDEVKKYCEMEEVHWVSSENNAADILTRGVATLEDIGPCSSWQRGPTFLSLRRDLWPVHRDFVRTKLPQEEVRSPKSFMRIAAVKVKKEGEGIDDMPELFGDVDKVLHASNCLESRKRVVARIVNGWKKSSANTRDEQRAQLMEEPGREDLIVAERLILLHGMVETAEAHEKGQLDSLMPYREGKLIVTMGRLGEKSLEPILGVSKLPILMSGSRVAELFMWRAHLGFSGLCHRSVAATLAKSRGSVWIVKGKQLAKKVCSSCMECRRERKKQKTQQMARLKDESAILCPPWTYIALDYAGPVEIKGEVNKRSRGKGWVLVYICRSTKAVCLLLTASYDTAAFLCKHEEFVARKGRPRKIVSDRGTQLVRSGIVLAEKNTPGKWDWAEVTRRNSASTWEFVPIGAPHRNGLAESTVKLLKTSLHHALAPGVVLYYSELITLLAKIAFSINSRPLAVSNISADSQQEDFLSPITPNQLLLARTDDDGPPLDYTDDDRFTSRMAYVTQVYNTWWDRWIGQVLPTLMPMKKWKKTSKNLVVGDVVMMKYPGNLKDDYRLARVTKTHPDEKGLVRTVTLVYRKRNSREKATVYKSKLLEEELVNVQRLSLLVSAEEEFK